MRAIQDELYDKLLDVLAGNETMQKKLKMTNEEWKMYRLESGVYLRGSLLNFGQFMYKQIQKYYFTILELVFVVQEIRSRS